MSKPNETPITAVPNSDEQPEVVKENLVKRGINFVKSHKKAALAVAGLVVLVGASAALGGSSNDAPVQFEPEMEDGPVIEIKDEDGNVTHMI
jgi:hypothetical protein